MKKTERRSKWLKAYMNNTSGNREFAYSVTVSH